MDIRNSKFKTTYEKTKMPNIRPYNIRLHLEELEKELITTFLPSLSFPDKIGTLIITPRKNQSLEDILKNLVQFSEPYKINYMNHENGEQHIWIIVCREILHIEIRWNKSCQMVQTSTRKEPVYEFICNNEKTK